MSVDFKNSFFYLLPNEIMIKILNDLSTFEVLQFCEMYECDYLFQDRNIVKDIDLSKEYRFSDITSLSKKIIYDYVTTLNINCLYWICASVLRTFVSKLVNLEELYAIKTCLSLTAQDMETYYKTKITKLGVSLKKGDKVILKNIPTLKTLYVHFVGTGLKTVDLDRLFPQLTKLWIDVESYSNQYTAGCVNCGLKTKIFCQGNGPFPFITFDYDGFRDYYDVRRGNPDFIMCSEKFTPSEMKDRKEDKCDNIIKHDSHEAWKILEELHSSLPFGPKDARRLFLKEAALDDIFFEELNFYHSSECCNQRSRQSERFILNSTNAKKIKRLCFMSCLLSDEDGQDESKNVRENDGFKRSRVGVANIIVKPHPAEALFNNLSDLEHLEIFFCRQQFHSSIVPAYTIISKFEKLRNLTLTLPVTIDGSFLTNVLTNCKHLERLKINSQSHNEKLNFNLCNALSHGTALKDLRFENFRIPLDKLIECLCLIKSKKLQRLVLICNDIDKFSAGPLTNFLDSNPQLIFLYFLIKNVPETSLKMARRTLIDYKTQHPARVFMINKKDISNVGYPTPDVHYFEMVENNSDVSNLRVLEEFSNF